MHNKFYYYYNYYFLSLAVLAYRSLFLSYTVSTPISAARFPWRMANHEPPTQNTIMNVISPILNLEFALSIISKLQRKWDSTSHRRVWEGGSQVIQFLCCKVESVESLSKSTQCFGNSLLLIYSEEGHCIRVPEEGYCQNTVYFSAA